MNIQPSDLKANLFLFQFLLDYMSNIIALLYQIKNNFKWTIINQCCKPNLSNSDLMMYQLVTAI